MKRRRTLGRKIAWLVVGALIFYGLILVILSSVKMMDNSEIADGEKALGIANTVARFTTADKMNEVLENNSMEDPLFMELQRQLHAIAEDNNVIYLYTFKPISDKEIIYIVDGYGTFEEEGSITPIGDVDLIENYDKSLLKTIQDNKAYYSEATYTEEYGNLISAYVPIQDERGKAVAYVGCDITAKSKSEVLVETITQSALVTLLLTIANAIFVIFVLRKWLTQPLQAVSEVMDMEANYDFSSKNGTNAGKYLKNNDEIGQLVQSIQKMEGKVRELLGKTIQSSGGVSASSEELTATVSENFNNIQEISGTVSELTNSISSQAQDTQKGADAMETMNGVIEENKQITNQLNQYASEVLSLKDEGIDNIQKLMEASRNTSESTKTVADIIYQTNESTKRIEKSGEMIRSIASQTNLLALNAAIEAARAGDAGRGFAVVADEIRALAEDSNKFTDEIMQIVGELTSISNDAVSNIESTTETIAGQEKQMDSTKEKFDDIASALERIQDLIENSNNLSTKLEIESEKMKSLLESLSNVSINNASSTKELQEAMQRQMESMKEINSASSDLAEIAQDLTEITSEFKI